MKFWSKINSRVFKACSYIHIQCVGIRLWTIFSKILFRKINSDIAKRIALEPNVTVDSVAVRSWILGTWAMHSTIPPEISHFSLAFSKSWRKAICTRTIIFALFSQREDAPSKQFETKWKPLLSFRNQKLGIRSQEGNTERTSPVKQWFSRIRFCNRKRNLGN